MSSSSGSGSIRQVRIWSGLLRLSHWVLGFGVLFQLFSAWALTLMAADPAFWRDWHLIVGQLVLLALLLRFGLLFKRGSGHWRSLLPGRGQLAGMLQMLKFYLSFARFPLPDWYSHNPLWQPLYGIILLVMLAASLTGLLLSSGTVHAMLGFSTLNLHGTLAWAIGVFSFTHILAVMLHDWKGRGALISAMFSGNRYFHLDEVAPGSVVRTAAPHEVSVDSLMKKNGAEK